jgi:hypothetical protein
VAPTLGPPQRRLHVTKHLTRAREQDDIEVRVEIDAIEILEEQIAAGARRTSAPPVSLAAYLRGRSTP